MYILENVIGKTFADHPGGSAAAVESDDIVQRLRGRVASCVTCEDMLRDPLTQ